MIHVLMPIIKCPILRTFSRLSKMLELVLSKTFVMKMWKEVFNVDDGDIRLYNDPEQARSGEMAEGRITEIKNLSNPKISQLEAIIVEILLVFKTN